MIWLILLLIGYIGPIWIIRSTLRWLQDYDPAKGPYSEEEPAVLWLCILGTYCPVVNIGIMGLVVTQKGKVNESLKVKPKPNKYLVKITEFLVLGRKKNK